MLNDHQNSDTSKRAHFTSKRAHFYFQLSALLLPIERTFTSNLATSNNVLRLCVRLGNTLSSKRTRSSSVSGVNFVERRGCGQHTTPAGERQPNCQWSMIHYQIKLAGTSNTCQLGKKIWMIPKIIYQY